MTNETTNETLWTDQVVEAIRAGARMCGPITDAVHKMTPNGSTRPSSRDIDRALQRARKAGQIRYEKVNAGGKGWVAVLPSES